MAIEDDLYTFVTADTDVAALVGNRMYPVVLPQSVTLPALRYLLSDDVPGQTQEGPDGLWRPRLQFDCYATRRSQARDLARAVLARLNGYQGAMGGSTIGALQAQNQLEMFEETVEAFRVMVDFRVLYND